MPKKRSRPVSANQRLDQMLSKLRDHDFRITPQRLAVLEDMLNDMKKHDTLKEVSAERKASREFHSAIAETTQNDLLIKLYAVVSNPFPDWLLYEALFRYPELIADTMANTYREHVAIVDALKKADAGAAVQKSIEHVMESGKWLEEYLGIPVDLLREKEQQVSSLLKNETKETAR